MEPQQQHLIEQQTNQESRQIHFMFTFTPMIMIVLGLILMFTRNGSGPSQSSSGPSSAMIALTEKMPYVMSVATAITSLVFLVLAFIARKESKRIVAFFLIVGLILMALAFLQFIMIPPQPQIIPVSH